MINNALQYLTEDGLIRGSKFRHFSLSMEVYLERLLELEAKIELVKLLYSVQQNN